MNSARNRLLSHIGWIPPLGAALLLSASRLAFPCTVTLQPGDDIQAAIDASPAGSMICLNPGTYRLTSPLSPKAHDIIDGTNRGAELNGSKPITTWTPGANYWYATGQTQQGTVDTVSPPGKSGCNPYASVCEASYTGCHYPDAVMYDDQPLWRVMCMGDLGPGKFFFNYNTDTIYIANDPNNNTVEAAITAFAFFNTGAAVTVQNLTIKNFSTPGQNSTINGGNDWIIQNNEVAYNHGSGIKPGAQTIGNYMHHNGQYGITGGATGQLVANNEIAYNNWAGYDENWAAGGSKFWETTNLTVRGNYVHDNQGRGLWDDTDNKGILYENNHTQNNWSSGIFHEIGEDAIIRNNLSENDGTNPLFPSTNLWYLAAIYLNTSENTEISSNTVINGTNGIGGSGVNRGNSLLYGFPYTLNHVYVHDNYIVMQQGSAAGMTSGVGTNVFTSNGNSFVHNHYCVASGVTYAWMNNNTATQAQWQGYGEDTTGVWSCTMTTSPVITSPLIATGRVGTHFGYQVAATNSPTSYNAINLPAGLGITPATGNIGGTPTQAGTTAVTIQATNILGTGSATLALTILPPLVSSPVITSAGAASGTVGQGFSYTITASNSPTSFSSTALPAGLSLNAVTGVISGNPSTAAATPTSVTIRASNSAGTGSATLAITIRAAAPGGPLITSAATATGTVGKLFSYTIGATNSPTSFAADGVPQGLLFNSTNGNISGTPVVAGVYSIGLQATNAVGTGTSILTLTILPGIPIIISPVSANATVGTNFSYSVIATNSPTTFTASGVPAWATFIPATGALYGVPTAIGPVAIVLGAKNSGGTGQATLLLMVNANGPSPTPFVSDLSSVREYPNPWRKDQTPTALITFDNLPPSSVIHIYTVSGHLVKRWTASSGRETWDMTNGSGDKVASGIYLYTVDSHSGDTVRGKLAIIK